MATKTNWDFDGLKKEFHRTKQKVGPPNFPTLVVVPSYNLSSCVLLSRVPLFARPFVHSLQLKSKMGKAPQTVDVTFNQERQRFEEKHKLMKRLVSSIERYEKAIRGRLT